jgi:hypothetical protein
MGVFTAIVVVLAIGLTRNPREIPRRSSARQPRISLCRCFTIRRRIFRRRKWPAGSSYVIDKRGIIRYKHIGPLRPETAAEKIRPLLRQLGG